MRAQRSVVAWLCCGLMLWALPALAEPSVTQLEQQATRIEKELDVLRRDMRQTAEAYQNVQAAQSSLEQEMTGLQQEAQEAEQKLKQQRENFTQLLGVLMRLARVPPELAIAQPQSAEDVRLTHSLLAASLPAIQQSAAQLEQDLSRLTVVQDNMAKKAAELAATSQELQQQQAKFEPLMKQKSALLKSVQLDKVQAQKRAQRLAQRAQNMTELLNNFSRVKEADKAPAEPSPTIVARERETTKVEAVRPARLPSFAKARGKLLMPMTGRIVTAFGQLNESGVSSRGLHIQTRSNTQVVAPYDGQVVYAGTFRTYGQLVIIQHSDGYHTLLAGLAAIGREVGDVVLAGEPIGKMTVDQSGVSRLYLELRKNGRPINPRPWIKGASTR